MHNTDISPDKVIGEPLLARVEHMISTIAAIAIGAMMLVVVLAVSMRYFFNSPLGWTYDIIGSYLMVCAFFFVIADGLRIHTHIAIDVFRAKIPPALIHVGMAIGYAASTALMLMIAWQGLGRLQSSWTGNDIINMTVPWPTWPTYFMLCFGCTLMALRCFIRFIAHSGSLVTGREIASMPPKNAEIEIEGLE